MTDDDKQPKPDPRDAANGGVSAQEPAEGADDTAPPTEGSPKG